MAPGLPKLPPRGRRDAPKDTFMTGLFRHLTPALTLVTAAFLATIARADTVSVDLSGLINSDLTTYTGGGSYPQHGGSITVGGIPFSLATTSWNSDTGVIQSSTEYGAGQTFTLNVNLFGVTSAYTLIDTAFGYCGAEVGAVEFVGSSTTYTYTLTEGANVRDHYEGSFCNSLTNAGGTAYFGADRLDMQSIVLPHAFDSEMLKSIEFVSYGQSLGGSPFLAAVTLDPGPNGTVPEPTLWPLGLIALLAAPVARRRVRQR